MTTLCTTCESRLPILGFAICGPCSAEREREWERERRLKTEREDKKRGRPGDLQFVPRCDAERRLHRQALRAKNYGSASF